MTTLEILKAARELISVPERWTDHYYARDKNGNYRFGDDPDAVKWCSIGALQHAASARGVSSIQVPWGVLESQLRGGQSLAGFNDRARHSDVLALFDRAIAKLEKEAK
jgi:hypothetical protein